MHLLHLYGRRAEILFGYYYGIQFCQYLPMTDPLSMQGVVTRQALSYRGWQFGKIKSKEQDERKPPNVLFLFPDTAGQASKIRLYQRHISQNAIAMAISHGSNFMTNPCLCHEHTKIVL